MKMTWVSRFFSGKELNPNARVKQFDNLSLSIASVAWGENQGQAIIESEVEKFLAAAQADLELTTPFERMGGITQEANTLRIALQLANDSVLRGLNAAEYHEAYEALLIWCKNRSLTMALVGEIQVWQYTSSKTLLPLLCSQSPPQHAFPQTVLGVETNIDVKCYSCPLQGVDSFFLIHGLKGLPISTEKIRTSAQPFDDLYNALAASQPESAFWLSQCRLSQLY